MLWTLAIFMLKKEVPSPHLNLFINNFDKYSKFTHKTVLQYDDVDFYLQTLYMVHELVKKGLVSKKTLIGFPKFFDEELIFTKNEYFNLLDDEERSKITKIVKIISKV